MVRWGYRIVCVLVSLIIGVLALLIGNTDILKEALIDLIALVVDAFYFSLGAIIFAFVTGIDFVQTVLGIEVKRRLTPEEIEILEPIFGKSLHYRLIRVIEQPGILRSIDGRPRAFTIGFNIYFPPGNTMAVLVHECVHVWQFQFSGTQYIGQSTVFQGIAGPQAYSWRNNITTDDNAWFLLESVEAKASFIEDVYMGGDYTPTGGVIDETEGAFFLPPNQGVNNFTEAPNDYTVRANHAWEILKT